MNPDSSPHRRPGGTDTRASVMAAALAGMGVLHFARPEPFDGLIPPELPGAARAWTYGSGVAELAVAGLLAAPATRRIGGLAATALFVGVYPGNLQMVREWRRKPVWPYQVIAWSRLPLQVPMILAGLSVYHAEGARAEGARR